MTRLIDRRPVRLPGTGRSLFLLALLGSLSLLRGPGAAVRAGDKDEPKKELTVLVNEDFKKVRLGALPKKWEGDFGAMDHEGRRCLESTKKKDVQFVKLPRVLLRGDFVIEAEFILDGSQFGTNHHELHVKLENARGETVLLKVNHTGHAVLQDNQGRKPAEFKLHQKSRLRFAKEDGVYAVQINGMDVTGARLAEPAGPFVAVHIGLTAGLPTFDPHFTAKLYSVKISGEGGGKAAAPAEASTEAPRGVREDFRSVKVGDLPKGWTSATNKIAVLVDGERRQLELGGGGPVADAAQLPAVSLKADFYVECTFLLRDAKTTLLIHLGGGKHVLNVLANGEGTAFIQTRRGAAKYSVSKLLKDPGQENLLRLERKDKAYILKLNGTEVTTMPTALVPGPFETVRFGLGIGAQNLRSPVIRSVRVVPLDDIGRK